MTDYDGESTCQSEQLRGIWGSCPPRAAGEAIRGIGRGWNALQILPASPANLATAARVFNARRRERPSRPRHGYTLIDTVLIVSLMTVLLSFIGTLFHVLIRADRHARNQQAHSASIARLAGQLRDDVHSASSVQLLATVESESRPSELVLLRPDGNRILYRIDGSYIQRIVSSDEQTRHRDSFRLLSAMESKWQVLDGSRRQVVVLDVYPSATSTSGEPASQPILQIRAMAGTDNRFMETAHDL